MSRLPVVLFVAASLLFFAPGCAPTEPEPEPAPPKDAGAPPSPGPPEGEAPAAVDPAATAKVAESVNAFGLAVYGQVRGEEGNLFLSPYSISSALAMTWAGARGETAKEMAETLRLPAASRDAPPQVHAAFGRLTASLNDPDAAYELSVANALWGQKGYGFQDVFIGLLKTHYGAGLREVDFHDATEAARRTINAWVEEKTEEKITDLIPEGMLVPQTRLVLTNAIYFLGTWEYPFDEERTKEEDFFAPSATVKVPMMRQTKHYRYADAGGHHVLQLPYKGEDLAMVLLVPKKKDGLAALEEALSREALAGWIDAMQSREVRVLLPRFKVTWRAMMKKVLSGMGMARAFDPEKADFTGMNGGVEPLWIGQVVHKAFVEVDEEGTEAAAATGVAMEATALPTEPPPEVRCDRPLVFLIRDTRSGAILFLGRLVNPAE